MAVKEISNSQAADNSPTDPSGCEWGKKLDTMRALRRGWNGYDAEPPVCLLLQRRPAISTSWPPNSLLPHASLLLWLEASASPAATAIVESMSSSTTTDAFTHYSHTGKMLRPLPSIRLLPVFTIS